MNVCSQGNCVVGINKSVMCSALAGQTPSQYFAAVSLQCILTAEVEQSLYLDQYRLSEYQLNYTGAQHVTLSL